MNGRLSELLLPWRRRGWGQVHAARFLKIAMWMGPEISPRLSHLHSRAEGRKRFIETSQDEFRLWERSVSQSLALGGAGLVHPRAAYRTPRRHSLEGPDIPRPTVYPSAGTPRSSTHREGC